MDFGILGVGPSWSQSPEDTEGACILDYCVFSICYCNFPVWLLITKHVLLQPGYTWRPPYGGMRNQTSQVMDSPTARPAEPGKCDPPVQRGLGRVSAVQKQGGSAGRSWAPSRRCGSRGCRQLGGSEVGGVSVWEEGLAAHFLIFPRGGQMGRAVPSSGTAPRLGLSKTD